MLRHSFFARAPLVCARELIGAELVWGRCRGRIVETEAYAALGDEASHTFVHRGTREFLERNPPGTAYVYLNYGVHWLFNVLVKGGGGADDGFVLVRALEPTHGLAQMRRRRGLEQVRKLCSGPGKLTRALGIDGRAHGRDLCASPAHGLAIELLPAPQIVADQRVGITRSADLPWRFLAAESPFVSVRPSLLARKV
jgi:DNA-3-methyladenine glycosylase